MASLLAGGGVARAEDWSHWRGPRRDDISREASGWDGTRWLENKPLWRRDVGRGSSSPLVIDDQVYAIGWNQGRDHLYCLDAATGKPRWEQTYSAPQYGREAVGDEGLYAGVCSTPEYDNETRLLYTLGIDGHLACWDTQQEGKLVWSLNLYDRFKIPRRPQANRSGRRDYGFTSSPLVHGQWLIVEAGAPAGTLIAFDKRTGQQRWASQATDPAGHTTGPAPLTVQGVPCAAVQTFSGLLVARLDGGHEGQTIAKVPWVTDYANNIASVAVWEENVIVTSSYNQQAMARFRVRLDGIDQVWKQSVVSGVCTPIIHQGHVYWAWKKMFCLDFDTGKVVWEGGRFGDAGSCIMTSDDRLIVWSDGGKLTLVQSYRHSPDRYQQLASIDGIARDNAWPHVVLSNGRVICKNDQGLLVCFARVEG